MPESDKDEARVEDARLMLKYFWEQKGDLSRWVGFEDPYVTVYFPDIVHLWQEYKLAEGRLDAAIKRL